MASISALNVSPHPAAPGQADTSTGALTEYLALSESLRQLRGADFEQHHHPAVVLDRATGPATRVWGWWAGAPRPVPCVLWASERGWSVSVVEPGALDSEGYERAFWAHRIHLLDLALANALGPCPTLELLELQVAADDSFGLGPDARQLRTDVQWGILQLRAARGRQDATGPVLRPPSGRTHCTVDEELALHALVPTLAKARWSADAARDAGLTALLRAVRKAERRSHSRAARVTTRAAGTPGSERPARSRDVR